MMLTIADRGEVGFALGASEYMTKPIDRNRLLAALEKYRPTDTSSRRKALVVEDDAATNQLLCHVLERAGWMVASADDGESALKQLAVTRPDVILLDLLMPRMDGFVFVTELRSRQAWRSVPVVVITAKEVTTEDYARLADNVDDIIDKGTLDRDDLLRELRELVRYSTRVGAA
jgi:CheY-like chemotaxis protein